MKRLATKGIFLLAAVLLSGACIYQYPDDGGTDPTLVEVRATIDIDNAYGTTAMPSAAKEYEVPLEKGDVTDLGNVSATLGAPSSRTRRVIVDAYRRGERERVERHVFTTEADADANNRIVVPVTLRLRALDYTLVAWCDYPADGTTGDNLYNTTDLRAVTCTEPYPGGYPGRQCARGTVNIDLSGFRGEWGSSTTANIDMNTPLARWRLVATDVRKFLDKTAADRTDGRTYSVRLSYGFYLPAGVDAMTGMPANSLPGVTFSLPLSLPDNGSLEAEIGNDYLFAADAPSFASVTVEIVDDTGKVVSRLRGLKIPLERGKITTARGAFLTTATDGGVNIDPDYEGDVDVDLDDLN